MAGSRRQWGAAPVIGPLWYFGPVGPAEYLAAVKPRERGCVFRPLFDSAGRVFLETGCAFNGGELVGAERELYRRQLAKMGRAFQIEVSAEVRAELEFAASCPFCGGGRVVD